MKGLAAALALLSYPALIGILPTHVIGPLLFVPTVIVIGALIKRYAAMGRVAAGFVAGLALITVFAWISTLVAVQNEFPVGTSVQQAARISMPLLFFVAAYFAPIRMRRHVYSAVLLIVTFHCVIALIQRLVGFEVVVHGFNRLSGALTPNIISNLAMFGAILAFGRLIGPSGTKNRRYQYMALFGFFCVFLLLAATLKNILLLAPAILLIYFLIHRGRLAPYVFAFAFIPALLLGMHQSQVDDRLLQVVEEIQVGTFAQIGIDKPSSLTWRIVHWRNLLRDWQENYLMFGAGIGQTINMDGIRAGGGYAAHNDWIALLVEGGVIIGVTQIGALFFLIYTVWNVRRLSPTMSTLFAAFAAFAFAMAVGNVLFSVGFLYLFWAVLGSEIRNHENAIARAKNSDSLRV